MERSGRRNLTGRLFLICRAPGSFRLGFPEMSTGSARAAARPRGPRSGLPLRARAAEAIEEQRSRMADNLGSAVDGRDPEGVHDMRVASRRLRAVLQVFGPWLDPGEVDRLATAARRVTRALGRVRELDVMRLALEAMQRRAQPLRAFAIEQVDAQLAAERRRARAKMMKRFARVDLEDFDERLRHLVAELRHAASAHGASAPTPASSPGDAGAEPTMLDLMRSVAPEVILHARRIVDPPLGGELGSAADREALHEVRIEAKKLRYILEILTPDLGPEGKRLVRRLRRLQERLGNFHDDAVLDATLAEAIERATRAECGRLAAELVRLRAMRKRSLLTAERGCRREIETLRAEGFADAVADALIRAGAIAREAVPETLLVASVGDTFGAPPAAGEGKESNRAAAAAHSSHWSGASPNSPGAGDPEGAAHGREPDSPHTSTRERTE